MKGSDKLKILVVVTAMEAGGLENYILNVLRVIDRRRYEIILISTGRESNFYNDELSNLGVETLFYRNSYSQIGYIVRMYKLMQKREPIAVCDFRNDFSASTLLAAKLCKVENRVAMYRSTHKGFRPSPFRNMYSQIMHACTKRLATKMIGNTFAVLDACFPEGHAGDKYAVVNNGVDVTIFRPCESNISIRQEIGVPANAIIVGHVGRLHSAKNHKVLLETFSELANRRDNVHLLLVGDGAKRKEIESDIEKFSLSDKVTLTGIRKDVHRLLGAMDIFFYPSVYEGLPNAMLEAMASGLPFVASNIDEIKEIIPNDLIGQLRDPDDNSGFLQLLCWLCDNRSYRFELGKKARQWTKENFALEASAKKLLRELIFQSVDKLEQE